MCCRRGSGSARTFTKFFSSWSWGGQLSPRGKACAVRHVWPHLHSQCAGRHQASQPQAVPLGQRKSGSLVVHWILYQTEPALFHEQRLHSWLFGGVHPGDARACGHAGMRLSGAQAREWSEYALRTLSTAQQRTQRAGKQSHEARHAHAACDARKLTWRRIHQRVELAVRRAARNMVSEKLNR